MRNFRKENKIGCTHLECLIFKNFFFQSLCHLIFLAANGTLCVDRFYRKRRLQKRSPVSIPIAVLDLDEGESSGQGIY